MSEFEKLGPSPEEMEQAPSADVLTLPFEGNPWVDFDKKTYQVVLHTKDGEKPIESGYRAILELAKEQGKNPEEAVAAVISSLRSEREEGMAQMKKVDEATFDRLSDQYGKRLGLFLGNERIRVVPGYRDRKTSCAGIDWNSRWGKGKPVIMLQGGQPDADIYYRDSGNKRAALATRQAIERIGNELGITSKYQKNDLRFADENWWNLDIPQATETLFCIDGGAYWHVASGNRSSHAFSTRELGLGDKLLPDKHDIEFPDPKIVAECERIYNEEMQILKQKKRS